MDTVSTGNAEHYMWGGDCDGWRLLARPDLAVTQERIPPGSGEILHFHEKARQVFYVLRGTLEIVRADRSFTLGQGDSLEIPPRAHHRVRNTVGDDVSFLVISAPSAAGDRINLEPPPGPSA